MARTGAKVLERISTGNVSMREMEDCFADVVFAAYTLRAHGNEGPKHPGGHVLEMLPPSATPQPL